MIDPKDIPTLGKEHFEALRAKVMATQKARAEQAEAEQQARQSEVSQRENEDE